MRGSLPGTSIDQENNRPVGSSLPKRADIDNEEALLLPRTDICPVCGASAKSSIVKNGKAIMNKMDPDLFIRHKNIDTIKYRVIGCPACGYATMDADFAQPLAKKELNSIKTTSADIKPVALSHNLVRSYDEAFKLYRTALSCSLIKGGKSSERGSIALHTAWLIRSLRDRDDSELFFENDHSFKHLCTEETEAKYLKYALQYLALSAKTEKYPIRGMEITTFEYLLSYLYYKTGKKREAYGYIVKVLHNQTTGNRIRSLAENLQELIREQKSARL